MDGFEDLRTVDGVEFDKAIWRHQNCDYSLPEETYIFYFDFRHRYWESFSAWPWPFWKERPFIGAGLETRPNPKLYSSDGEPLPEYVPALLLQDWIRRAIPIMQKLADAYGVDFRPLLWFKRSISSGDRMDTSDRRTTDDFLEQIEFNLGISDGTVNRERQAAVCRGDYPQKPEPLPVGTAVDAPESSARHAPGFRSVHWFGDNYTFTRNQAKCVEVLWASWKQQTPVVDERSILTEADCNGDRLRDVFKNSGDSASLMHPAWGSMIVADGKGAFRLQEKTRTPQ